MKNEIMEDVIQETPSDQVEIETDIPVSETDLLSDTEVVEDVPPSVEDVSKNENIPDSPVLEETTPEESTPEESAPEESAPEESITENETGETDNEDIYEMDNGYEDFYDSVSCNDIGDGGNTSSDVDTGDGIYVTNYYTMETAEVIPLWENNISNFSTSEMLLFLIFLLLLVQFVHNIFKGSHWLKG